MYETNEDLTLKVQKIKKVEPEFSFEDGVYKNFGNVWCIWCIQGHNRDTKNTKTREWLKVHNYIYIHNRDTKNMHRFRIREQVKGMKFYTLILNNGVESVYMY
jgi:hypothetical protein